MGIGDVLLKVGLAGLAAVGIGSLIKDGIKESERKSTECSFDDLLSQDTFANIAKKEAKQIKRLKVDVDGHIIKGTVKSVSGLTHWNFTLDFNDYGHISGKYWKKSENDESTIPDVLGDRIQKTIETIRKI